MYFYVDTTVDSEDGGSTSFEILVSAYKSTGIATRNTDIDIFTAVRTISGMQLDR